MDDQAPGDRQTQARAEPGLLGAIRIDIVRIHETWMGLVFPRQRDTAHSVLGKWTPSTTMGKIRYRLWGAIGILVIGLIYPLAVLGFATRFYSSRINRSAASLGFLGVILLSIIVWGALTAATYFSRISFEGFVAVGAAGGVATLSAVLALLFTRIGGRITTVVFGYPFAVTAIFLPPVVAALYSPSLAQIVFPRSQTFAIWILDNILDIYGINAILRARFDLVGLAYVGMWFGLAVPIGWILGILVSIANLVRPTADGGEADAA